MCFIRQEGWALMLYVLYGYCEDGSLEIIDDWWLMMATMMTTIEYGFFPGFDLSASSSSKYHHMELALCRGPVWEDILTGKWAHFQLGTGNEKKPRQTESKSKQIPMRPGWGSRLHRVEPNGGF